MRSEIFLYLQLEDPLKRSLSISISIPIYLVLVCNFGGGAIAQTSGAIEGTITLPTGAPAHRVTVVLTALGRTVETDEDGHYRFDDVPAGIYEVLVFQSLLDGVAEGVEVTAGQTRTLDIMMRISPIRVEITVTARGREETTFEAVPSVTSLDAFDLAEAMAPSLGDVLDGQLGVSKRSFGSGNARPVIRGFDGDRILVMQDSMPVGALGSQSGDHSEPVDVSNLERVEILKGPATLLYGSNAIGGVVNAISSHQSFHDQPHTGLTGQVSSSVGTANGQAGSSFNMEYGVGNWAVWTGGGGQRTRDYDTPIGVVKDSRSRITNGSAGFGWFGDRAFASVGYRGTEGRNGIPFVTSFEGEEEVDGGEELDAVNIALRQHTINFTTGVRDLGAVLEEFRLSVNYSDYNHDEVEIFRDGNQAIGTTFENQQIFYRGVFTQRTLGRLSGSFGVSGLIRQFEAAGEEAITPPVDQTNFGAFTLQDVDFERVQLQFGGRVDYNRYEPHGGGFSNRSLTGFSGGIGARFDLWAGGAFVANYTDSFRSPALEELYNLGPHLGNLTFEIGDPNLLRERSHGFDFSLRQESERVRGEVNAFYYDIDDFVFLAPTGAVVDGLTEAEYSQGDVRFLGMELKLDVEVHENLWLNLALDSVDTKLKQNSLPLPRIPPLRGTVGLDLRYVGLSIKPEIVMVDARSDIFTTETPTAGYAVANLKASYTIPRQHFSHHIAMAVFNMSHRLYRNHVSFIKDLAPEIGRGVRLSYAVKFF